MKRSRNSFTLIEMLVVIAIIGILSGIVFKMFSMVTRRGEVAQAMQEMQAIAGALTEFYAEYGQYPPVSGMTYEFENTGKQHPVFCNTFLPQNPDWAGNTLFDYSGLISWLWPRVPGGGSDWPLMPGSSIQHTENVQWIGDTGRDLAAKRRWARFLADITLTAGESPKVPNMVSSGEGVGDVVNWPYTNDTLSLNDPWGSSYQYESLPPYLDFKLWSLGPDSGDPSDDILREGWD